MVSRNAGVFGNVRSALFLLLLVLAGVQATSQDRRDGAYMIPPRVFVGDRATFVLPLPGFIVQASEELGRERIPSSPDMDIYRIALERRPGGNRLVVEFTAYAPGTLTLPTISIAGEVFSGLRVQVSSMLEPGESGKVLSGPADPMAIPGTSLLIYGTISASVVVLLLGLWAVLWGRRQMKDWLQTWKRRRLLLSMLRIERHLRRNLAKGAGRREILDRLSSEFRSFLSYFSGKSCRAMTATEFIYTEFFEEYPDAPGGTFLGGFFGRCDGVRFSRGDIDDEAALALLADVKLFLKTLDQAMRKKDPHPGEAA